MRLFSPNFSWLLIPATALLFLAMPAVLAAGGKNELKDKILEQQHKMHRLHKGIEEQKNRVFQTQQKEVSLLAEMERLETQLTKDRDRLAALGKKISTHEEQIRARKAELDALLHEQEELQDQVKQRLAAYYRTGRVGMLNALFSANTLPDLINLEEYFQCLVRHDRQVIGRYRQSIAAVASARQRLEEQKKELNAVLVEVRREEQQSSALQQQKMALLTSVRTEKKLYQRAIEELEQAATRLTATLLQLRREAAAGGELRTAPPVSPDFAAQKGHLPPPVAGTVVTPFGQEVEGKFGITTRVNGIDIKTEAGAQIKAVYSGTVLYSGYLRGYGNLLIIDHGQQYYSLMSRGGRFFKKKEEIVRKGEVVGLMGDQNDLLSEGLHFEIRHGSDPEDPLLWLDRHGLQLAADIAESEHPANSSSP